MRAKGKIIIFGLVVPGIILLFSIGIYNNIRYKDKVREIILTLNSIRYLSIDSTVHEIASGEHSKVIFFFSSDCEHCQQEARLVSDSALSLRKADVYFFSEEDLSAIRAFAAEYDLIKSPFKIGQVDVDVFYRMGVNTRPMCFIYSPEGKLRRKYVGQVKIGAIVKYLQ